MTPTSAAHLLLRRVCAGPGGPMCDVRLIDGTVAALHRPGADADGAQVVDGRGGTVLPGLRDQHVHLSQWAMVLDRIDVSGAESAAAAVRTMARAARSRSPRDVLYGYGFRDGRWPDRPHKDMLQRALPGRVVALVSNDLHTTWLSPAALAHLGVDHPTGLLREADSFDAQGRLPQPTDQERNRSAIAAAERAARRGITQILDFEFADTLQDWTARHHLAGTLPVRVTAAVQHGRLDAAIDSGARTGDTVPDTDGLVTVGPCKVLIDGSLNTRTALCYQPYPGAAAGADAHGMLTVEPDQLVGDMRRAAQAGIEFAVHAIGDRANAVALDCFRAAGCRGRIEHAQLVRPDDLRRFAALGVVAGVQPAHAPEDRDIADALWAGRTEHAYPYRALLDAGARLEFGSDAPVSRLDPWHAIACAVTRTDDERPGWHPEQALSLREAIAACTAGRIAPTVGMGADLVLVAEDVADIPAARLRDVTVLATLVGGRFTYRAI